MIVTLSEVVPIDAVMVDDPFERAVILPLVT